MNNNSQQFQVQKVANVWWMLKFTFGLVPILAGLDKLGFNFITNWAKYLNPTLVNMVPVSQTQLLYLVGVIEIIAGLLVLTHWTRFGAYLVAAWLTLIAVTLIPMGMYDISIRDIGLAIGALSLGMLTEALGKK